MDVGQCLKSGWRKLLKVIEKAENLEELFKLLLTQKERMDLAQRILIIEALLKKKNTQRDIAKHLHVSIAKITRGSNELKIIDAKLRKFLEGEL